MRSGDLRPYVHHIVVEPVEGNWCNVSIEASIGQEGSARPDHVLTVLGFDAPAESIHRVALLLEGQEEASAPPQVV